MKKKPTGPTCSYGGTKCPPPTFGIQNDAGAIVSHICDKHIISPWGATDHIGLTVVPLGRKEPTDEVGTAIEDGGRIVDPDGPQGNQGAVEPGTWEPYEDRVGRGQSLVPRPPNDLPQRRATSDALSAVAEKVAGQQVAISPATDPYVGAGTLFLTDLQEDVLMEPWAEDLYQVRDDGEVYMPWQNYATRLTSALGPFAWALVPLEKPSLQGSNIFVRYALIIKGHFVADAVESHPYYPGNRNMTYDDAVESAKSECLRRLCKGRVGDLNAWDARWRSAWRAEWATRVWRTKAQRLAWRRKDAEPYPDEGKPGYSGQSEYDRGSRLQDENQRHIDAINGREPGEEG